MVKLDKKKKKKETNSNMEYDIRRLAKSLESRDKELSLSHMGLTSLVKIIIIYIIYLKLTV